MLRSETLMSLLDHENAFAGGTIEDGKVAFQGELKIPMGRVPYSVSGTLLGGRIDAIARTKMGDLTIRSR